MDGCPPLPSKKQQPPNFLSPLGRLMYIYIYIYTYTYIYIYIYTVYTYTHIYPRLLLQLPAGRLDGGFAALRAEAWGTGA